MFKEVGMDSSGHYPSWPPNQDCVECSRSLKPVQVSSQASPKVDTLQCTDKCIVVACDQPDHLDGNNFDDMFGQCISPECEGLCDIAHEEIEWPCAEPGCAMKELLQCCLNEIPSSASSLHATQHCAEPHGEHHWSWMHSDAATGSVDYSQIHRKSHTYPPQIVVINNRSHHTLFDETPAIRCMWGPCTRSFPSQMDLLSHLQSEHLHPFSGAVTSQYHQHEQQNHYASLTNVNSPSAYDSQQMNRYFSDDPTTKAFSCLWDDCGLNISIPVQNQCTGCVLGHQQDTNLDADVLLSHLLTNHLLGPKMDAQVEFTPTSFVPETSSESGATAEFSSLPSSMTETDSSGEPAAFLCEWQDCVECFNSSDDLNTHITDAHIGHGKSSYECLWRGCDRHGANAFPSKQKVIRHVQKHSGFKPHVCSVCRERFAETTSLQQHMRRHTQEKPYLCDFPGCGKAFSIPGGLRIHKRAHSGEKPFKCPEPGCERAFSESSNLAKHMRIHSGLKPFHCTHPGCGRQFGRKDQLMRHAALHRTFSRQQEADMATVAS